MLAIRTEHYKVIAASVFLEAPFAAPGNAFESNLAALAALGYREAVQAAQAIDALRHSQAYRMLGDANLRRFEDLVGVVVRMVASGADPDDILCPALALLESLGRWPGYIDFLLANRGPLRRLLALLGASPALGRYLLAHPVLFDDLADGRNFCNLPDPAQLRATLARRLAQCADSEGDALAHLRRIKHEHVLHIVSLDLEGLISLDQVSRALSDLADVLLEVVLQHAARHLKLEGPAPMGIIGYGKLGSREMSYASDTDIVFVYDDGADPSEDALHRLARTVNRWITLPTAEGALYQTDFRMRPYGEGGLLITPLAAYRRYLLQEAWTWEHQALTRARCIAGDARLTAAFEQTRREVLVRPRDPARLRQDLCEMRERIAAAHPAGREGFDVKHCRGGIIDLEFAVQYLVLCYAAAYPDLAGHYDNAETLHRSGALGLLPQDLAREASAAYLQFRRWLHASRLRGIESARVSESEAAAHRGAVLAVWRHLICS